MPKTVMARFAAFLLLLGGLGLHGVAGAAEPSPAFTSRAGELVGLLNGGAEPSALFSPAFLNEVPPAQVTVIVKQLRDQFGAALAVERIEAESSNSGIVFVAFEKALLKLNLTVAPEPPHLVAGLQIVGSEVKGDSLAAIVAELHALPGRTSLQVARLDTGQPVTVIAHDADQPMAIGSTFKLFLLGELARSVRAGERRWSDVVPLSHRSLPSGLLQDWPKGAPLTLHSLAALMISQSDNSATDTLLHVLGREKVEAMLPALGLAVPERNRPFLSTLEAFALKTSDEAVFAGWTGADEARRRAMIASRLAPIRAGDIALASIFGAPARIETAEWFASAADLVRTMNWLRLNADQAALDILAVNPGIGRAAADGFAYLGFKGGSEPGVINLTFLVRAKNGSWHGVAASWNNSTAAVDEAGFVALISRAVTLLR